MEGFPFLTPRTCRIEFKASVRCAPAPIGHRKKQASRPGLSPASREAALPGTGQQLVLRLTDLHSIEKMARRKPESDRASMRCAMSRLGKTVLEKLAGRGAESLAFSP